MLASHSLPPTSRLRSSSRHGPARAVTSASLIFAAADKADVVLSFDIGTTATKACAVDQNGRILSSATAPYARGTTSAGSTSEQFPGDWLEAARSSCRDTLAVLPGARVAALAFTGQMQDIVLTAGAERRLVRDTAILYSDGRASAEAAELEARFGPDRLKAETTNLKGGASCLAKWLWLRKHEPSRLEAADTMLLGAHSFVVAQLTGAALCDRTTASTTGLLAPSGDAYCEPLIRELGLKASLLPALHLPSIPAGTVSPVTAEALGLPREVAGAPVFHCGGDLAATARGAGAPSHLYLGTSGWIARVVADKPQPPAGGAAPGVFRVAAADPGASIVAGSTVTAGGCVEWARKALLGGVSPAEFDRAAAAAPPGSRGVLFLPYLSGERSPFVDFEARGAFVGLSQGADSACLARAVLEGVALAYRSLSDALSAAGPSGDLSLLPALGGGSRSALWMQTISDCLRVPLEARGSGGDAAARGAAAWAWSGLGAWGAPGAEPPQAFFSGGEEAGGLVRFEPDEARSALFDRVYEQWRVVYPALAAAGVQGGATLAVAGAAPQQRSTTQ